MGKDADIKITRINNSEYSFKLSSNIGLRHVAKALTFRNPDAFSKFSKIEKFDKKSKTFKIGMLSNIEEYIRVHGLSYELTDYDYDIPKNTEIDDRMSGKYIHQKKAVEAFYKRRFGIIVVPTRGGKTFIASEILRIFLNTEEGDFLFIVDNKTLFTQATEDIKKYFERYGGIEVGEIMSGKVDVTKRVTVAMIQTIQSTLSGRCKDRNKKKQLEKYIKNLKFLCVDEIHDNCADSKLKIYKKCKNIEYQLCLSATPYRSGAFVQNLKLQAWSGDIIYTITEKKLRERKVLSDYKVFMPLIDHNDSLDYDNEFIDYNECQRRLIFNNEKRNDILLKIIDILRCLNLKTLILFQNIEHGSKISSLTDIPFISGVTKTLDREKEKEKFLKGKGGFLLASNIFKKGVTLSQVEVLLSVDGGLEDANTIQKKGRVLGTSEGKSRSLVIDFFDLFDAYFSDHSTARLKAYIKAIGEKNVEILDTSVDGYLETLKRWTIKWFEKDKNFSDTL